MWQPLAQWMKEQTSQLITVPLWMFVLFIICGLLFKETKEDGPSAGLPMVAHPGSFPLLKCPILGRVMGVVKLVQYFPFIIYREGRGWDSFA